MLIYSKLMLYFFSFYDFLFFRLLASCEDDDFPAWQFKRIGWSIYPDIPYPEEGGDK